MVALISEHKLGKNLARLTMDTSNNLPFTQSLQTEQRLSHSARSIISRELKDKT
jgi:hypothetical protein